MYTTSSLKIQVVVTLFFLILVFLPQQSFAATIQVTSNADNTTGGNGLCTLREAIANANSDSDTTSGDCVAGSGTDTITFNAAMTITPTASFTITSPIILNAITGGLGVCTTKTLGVVIDGSAIGSVFDLNTGSNGSTIRGFAITNNSGAGVNIQSSSNHTISCNMIGLNQAGTAATGTGGGSGIVLNNSSGTVIGGLTAGDGNVVSGNASNGIALTDTTTTSIFGNIIGLTKDGTTTITTHQSGISIDHGTDITIGGATAAHRNVISGSQKTSTAEGVIINDSVTASSGITIQGNYFGTDSTGMLLRNSLQQDIEVCGFLTCGGGSLLVATNITIGGSNAGEGNLFAGGGSSGSLSVDSIIGLTVLGNTFGIASDGTTVLDTVSNASVAFYNITTGVFGGSGVNEGNVVANNYLAGFAGQDIVDVEVIGNRFNVAADGLTVLVHPGTLLPLHSERGIVIGNGTNVIIGGSGAGEENVLAGFDAAIALEGSTGFTIVGNYVGVGVNGTTPLEPSLWGIALLSSDGVIGGDTSADGNMVSYNEVAGFITGSSTVLVKNNIVTHQTVGGFVVFDDGVDFPEVTFLENSMYDNTGLAIEIGTDLDADFSIDTGVNVNVNDVGDTDTGANNYINRPIILKTEQDSNNAANLVVTYMLDVPTTGFPYYVEFYKNPSGLSSSNSGEAETFITSDQFIPSVVPTAGQHMYTKILPATTVADDITMSVTPCLNSGCTLFGGTSEFSNASPRGVDFGTASGSQTLAQTVGAYHLIPDGNIYMGTCVNADSGTVSNTDISQPNQPGAFEGTGPCSSDKDGVTVGSSYLPSSSITLPVSVSDAGFLNVWIDANLNGSFSDGGERIITNQAVTSGSNTVSITVPASDGSYNLRFRYTSYNPGTMLPIGEALNGEVEDYVLVVSTPTVTPTPTPSTGGGIVPPSIFTPVTSSPVSNSTQTGSSGAPTTPSVATPPVPGAVEALPLSQCPFFTGYYKKGARGPEIKKIQIFLNKEVNAGLPTNGIFGPATDAAVRKFQQKYFSVIITPWVPPEKAQTTGYWYKTTRMKANQLSGCREGTAVMLESNGKMWILAN
jgi:CSLREA domain-containing protein